MVDVKLNLGPKRAGLKLEEDVDLTSNIEGDLPGLITKRELWRVAQGQYDPLGLLCAYTVRFKIVMRSLAEEQSGRVVGWDEPVPPGTDKVFREIISHLGELRKISFPRSAQPLEKSKESQSSWYLGMARLKPAARSPTSDGSYKTGP